jgi:UPF0755 protein
MIQKRTKITIIFLVAALIASFFYAYRQIYFSHGGYIQVKDFEIVKGEGNAVIGSNLEKEGLISNKLYFYYYIRTHGLINKFLPGKYEISGNMTIPEIAIFLSNQENMLPGYINVTFPEGWTAEQMAQRLKANGFDGDAFLNLVKNPPQDIVSLFPILVKKPAGTNLEGYLFPDTYKFSKDATPGGILKKILNNTELKITPDIRSKAESQKKSIFQVLTMASILEKEVNTTSDFKIVSGIFWQRIAIGQALQSDATLEYVLKTGAFQHSVAQTKTDSPYNTYMYRGLPPGPISNPGMDAITAALNPEKTNYNYFLTDPNNPKNTVYSVTFQEHVANKLKFGL